MKSVEHLQLAANGQHFYCAAAGPLDGPLVVLLHGFPELSYGWRHQIWPLADAGFRVLAPDQRGYGHSSKPRGRKAYVIEALGADVVAIAASVGRDRFSVVGHDWGGIVAWHLAGHHAERVERLAVLNAPNVEVFAGYALKHPGQLVKSAYVAAFQLAALPELALRANDFALLRGTLEQSSRPGTFSGEELDVYATAWSRPGALTAMLNWYRALPLRQSGGAPARVAAPTLVVWGDRDVALQPALAEASAALCDQAEVGHVEGAGHFVQHEEAAKVNALLVAFLRQGASGKRSP